MTTADIASLNSWELLAEFGTWLVIIGVSGEGLEIALKLCAHIDVPDGTVVIDVHRKPSLLESLYLTLQQDMTPQERSNLVQTIKEQTE